MRPFPQSILSNILSIINNTYRSPKTFHVRPVLYSFTLLFATGQNSLVVRVPVFGSGGRGIKPRPSQIKDFKIVILLFFFFKFKVTENTELTSLDENKTCKFLLLVRSMFYPTRLFAVS